MVKEWQVELNIPDIGAMITLCTIAICSAIIGTAEIAYTMMWITAAYERNGKDFFIDLLSAQAYTWTAEFIIVAGSLLLISAIIYFITMTISLIELNAVERKTRRPYIKIIFGLFFIGLILLIIALLSAILLKYKGVIFSMLF
ncbi:MAG: hypothetical protein ACE5J9_05385 [Methanosarcinales archaeon]